MAYWLMKSEPASYSWSDLVRDGGTEWDGVRNNAARLHLRAMKKGDEAFFYHSMSDKAVVGIMRIVREAQPDSKDADWVSVRVEPVRPLAHVTLAQVKAEPRLAQMVFEAPNGLTHCGLRAVQPRGGLREAALGGNGEKDVQFGQFHRHASDTRAAGRPAAT